MQGRGSMTTPHWLPSLIADVSRDIERNPSAVQLWMMLRALLALAYPTLLVLLLVSPAQAEPRLQFPTASGRSAANVISWGTSLAPVALDAWDSWHEDRRARAMALWGVRLGVVQGGAFLLKKVIHEERPCAPNDCGVDNPDFSMPSAHTATAFQARGGPRLSFVIPLGVSTAGLRVAAGKHWVKDTVVGAGIGLAASYIR